MSNHEAGAGIGEYLRDTVPEARLRDRSKFSRYNADADAERNQEAQKVMKGTMLFASMEIPR